MGYFRTASPSAYLISGLVVANTAAVLVASCGGSENSQEPATTSSSSTSGGQAGAAGAGANGGSGASSSGAAGSSATAGSGGAGGSTGSGSATSSSGGGGTAATGSGGSGATAGSSSSGMTSSSSAGGGGGGEDAGLPDALPNFPDAEYEPVTTIEGIPKPLAGVYDNPMLAPAGDSFRALMAFPIRDRSTLEDAVDHIYDPAQPSYRQYMTAADWIAKHAPPALDVQIVKLWVESMGMQVQLVATNRLLFEFTGTVQQFNDAFQTELYTVDRKNPQVGNPPFKVFATLGTMTVPTFVAERISSVLTADLPPDTDPLPGEAGSIVTQPPANVAAGFTPAQIAKAYEIDKLHAMGYTGQGVTIGAVVGATFKFKDLQSFWQSFGIVRADPQVAVTMEPIATRYLETTLDVEWSGALAPSAGMIVYSGPDSRNTSMLYTFNEAIARNEVSVLTDSFAHREDSEAKAVRNQYSDSALMGAALGITICAATGDSGETDTPSSSPYVTGVGGTQLFLDANGGVANETAWDASGSGATLTFPLPAWQAGIVSDSNGKRALTDVAMNASPAAPMWIYYSIKGGWLGGYGGTSFASPMFAGLIAVVNSYLIANNLPVAGWLNRVLYTTPSVQATFRDITSGQTPSHAAGVGWDYPSGWGAPRAQDLAIALP
jgi:kumamolisin